MKHCIILMAAVTALAGCGDPMYGVEKLSDVKLAESTPVRDAIPSENETSPGGGILGQLLDPAATTESDAGQTATDDETRAEPAPKRRGGLAGWLLRNSGSQPAAAPVPETTEPEPEDAKVDVAAIDPDAASTEGATTDTTNRGSGGFLSFLKGGNSGASDGRTRASSDRIDIPDVPFGTLMPYGHVARVCEAKSNRMGREIETAGKNYKLFDSAPGATTQRTFYVTGFADGCPRQFTAALAMFGSPSMHEQLRYGRPSKAYPYSKTDEAYEKVKSDVCRARRSKPCGAKIGALERDTVFISTYERFTDNGRWADILLHDGAVMAAAFKTP